MGSPDVDTFLAHHGVKGMKWGVRKDRNVVAVATKTRPGKRVKASGGKNHMPSDDAIKTAVARRKAKKSTTDSLSNAELRAAVERMNLEQQYSRLTVADQSLGRKLVKALFGSMNDQNITAIGDFAAERSGNTTVGEGTALGVRVGRTLAKSGGGGSKKK